MTLLSQPLRGWCGILVVAASLLLPVPQVTADAAQDAAHDPQHFISASAVPQVAGADAASRKHAPADLATADTAAAPAPSPRHEGQSPAPAGAPAGLALPPLQARPPPRSV